ncbi:hypothetical protein ACXHQK_21600 [Vibrio chemaguriensis]
MPKFAGCLIGFRSWLVVSFTDSKRCKGKFIGSASSLVVLCVESREAKAESLAEIHH